MSDFGSVAAALPQFYRALNSRDIALMEQNWDATDEAAMNNPLGAIERAWAEIRSVYERLFDGASRYQFEFYNSTLQRYGEVFIAIGRERGQFVTEDAPLLYCDPHHSDFRLGRRSVAADSSPWLH